jgi:hypothetical protein
MKPIKIVAAAMIVGGLGFGSMSVTAPMASAQPVAPIPQKPGGHGNDDYCPPWCGDTKGPNRYCPPWCDNNVGHGDDKGFWDDRNGPPPWGWGPPPPIQWNGGPPPQSVNYWGYNLNPVWNDGPRQWGVWLFGLWIPIFGVGFN